MNQPIEKSILDRLVADPSLQFLNQKFICIDNVFSDPGRIVETFGCIPIYRREYTLIEIRYTSKGFVGNFRELPPITRYAGFDLIRFNPINGYHPNFLLNTEAVAKITRAKFGTCDYYATGLNAVRYAEIESPLDGSPVVVYNFDPLLLEMPPVDGEIE